MNVSITREMADAIGIKVLKPFGVQEEKLRWSTSEVDLARMNTARVRELRELVKPHARLKGASAALRDMNTWVEAAEKGVGGAKCKQVKQFAALAYEYLRAAPRHRLYKKDTQRDVWLAYYVGEVRFVPAQTHRDGTTPAHCVVSLFFDAMGGRRREQEVFHLSDVRGLTVPQALGVEGYVVETAELAATYDDFVARYVQVFNKIGLQLIAWGTGMDDLDDATEDDRGYHRWGGPQKFDMERDGQRSRVVVDVFRETDKSDKDNDAHFDINHWAEKSLLDEKEDAKDDLDDVEPGDIDEEETEEAVVPLHPIVPVFDLRRQMRLRVHVGNLEPYLYDTGLGDKLVLPEDSRRLVSMLLSHKGGFRDIIAGKGGGSIILCAGTPGTGKTLTAEVYAEVDQRPLFTVQCSQLGLDPDELEKHLLIAFRRAKRWNAILLLDEADVYVAQRGSNLQQNAIVGVFLRVLEYYSGVLFLTTNRADLVDDAIASRCVARIDYGAPVPEDLARIWAILSQAMYVTLEPTSEELVSAFPGLTGRDVKNLLKLAILVTEGGKRQVTLDDIRFVKRFKPTQDQK